MRALHKTERLTMTKYTFLSLLMTTALSACAPTDSRLVPRYVLDPTGHTVTLPTYLDTVTGRTCQIQSTPVGSRCVTSVNYGPVLYRAQDCTGPGLTDPTLFTDVFLRAANRGDGALYEACAAPEPALSMPGPWFVVTRPERCVPVGEAVDVSTYVQICPVDMTQFPIAYRF